jgi:hypothetical protein
MNIDIMPAVRANLLLPLPARDWFSKVHKLRNCRGVRYIHQIGLESLVFGLRMPAGYHYGSDKG